ncbi:MAG: hypothetical protein ACYDAG_03885 [Chloroflexota bacterium]
MTAEISSALAEAAQLTPSELVCLFGTQFAPKHGKPDAAVPAHLPGKEENHDLLAYRTLAAALLADEGVGSLRLEIASEKKLFGLRTAQVITAIATDTAPPFPGNSWEAILHQRLTEVAGRTSSVEAIIWVPKSPHTAREVFKVAFQGLIDRGLVVATEKTMLKIHYTDWALAEGAEQVVAQQPLDPVRRLLEQAEQTRPEIWNPLTDAIKTGIKNCYDGGDIGSGAW